MRKIQILWPQNLLNAHIRRANMYAGFCAAKQKSCSKTIPLSVKRGNA